MYGLHNPTGLQLHDHLVADRKYQHKHFPSVNRNYWSLSFPVNKSKNKNLPPLFWRFGACSLDLAWCNGCSEGLWCGGSSSDSPESSTSTLKSVSGLFPPKNNYMSEKANVTLVIEVSVGSHLELGDNSDFTEPFGRWVLSVLVDEDFLKQGIIRFVKQTEELWGHWVL